MKRKVWREVRLFVELFLISILPSMVTDFAKDPSLNTLPDAYVAFALYGSYRTFFLWRESLEREEDRDEGNDPPRSG